MKTHLKVAAMSALVLLAACNQPAADNGGAANNGATPPAGSNSAAPANVAAAEKGDEHGGHETGKPTLLLAADGIEAGGTEGSKIAFGAPQASTIDRVTPLLGKTYDRDQNKECGAGPMEFLDWGKVFLMFQGGKFVGWELRQQSEEPWIGTPGGATIGTSRAELQTALGAPLKVEKTSLGIEFNAGGFTGLLDSEKPDAKLTGLWAGSICAMR